MNWFLDRSITRSLLGRDAANAYFAFRIVLGLIVAIPGVLAVVGYICYWVYRELSLESRYRQKYGTEWQAEFEQYHGSLAHAHMQIAVCSISMLALLVVVFFAWRVFLKPKQTRHHHAA